MAMISTGQTMRPNFGFGAVIRMIEGMIAVKNQRARLKSMDWAQLDDLGLTAKQAMREANRPIWSAPAHWMR